MRSYIGAVIGATLVTAVFMFILTAPVFGDEAMMFALYSIIAVLVTIIWVLAFLAIRVWTDG